MILDDLCRQIGPSHLEPAAGVGGFFVYNHHGHLFFLVFALSTEDRYY